MWICRFPSTNCWKECPFPIELSWHPYEKSLPIYVRVYFWTFCSIRLVYMSVFVPVPHTVLIIIFLWYVLKSGNVFFVIQVLLLFRYGEAKDWEWLPRKDNLLLTVPKRRYTVPPRIMWESIRVCQEAEWKRAKHVQELLLWFLQEVTCEAR